MSTCSSNHLNMWLYSRELAKIGYAIKTVQIEAGMTYKQIQKMFTSLEYENQIEREKKKSFRKSSARLLSGQNSKLQASLLMLIYVHIAGPNHRTDLNINALNKAYTIYSSMYHELPVSIQLTSKKFEINDGWILANEIRSGEAGIETCLNCNASFFNSEHQNTTIDCPFCYKGREPRKKTREKD